MFRLGLIRLFEREPDLVTLWDIGSLDELGEMLDKSPVDVILMDLNLGPDQDALAATRKIREESEAVRVIIVSGSLDFEWAAASRAALRFAAGSPYGKAHSAQPRRTPGSHWPRPSFPHHRCTGP